MRIIPAAERHCRDFGKLKTCWLFSFSDYYDPDNEHFGALRVVNDDVVQPGMGFPTHPHRDFEILTVGLDGGRLEHKDSTGASGSVGPNEVQRMTAGSGVSHSEYNHGTTAVHFLQVWFFPTRPGLAPSWEHRSFDPALWKNRLFAVASGFGREGAVPMQAAADFYRADLDAGLELEAPLSGGNLFVYVLSGAVRAGGVRLGPGDQLRQTDATAVKLLAETQTRLVLVDAADAPDWITR